MFEKFTRSARIGASYAGVLGDLVGLEARLEIQRIVSQLRQRAVALVLLLVGVVWLNVGVFVLIWDSPYRHLIPFAIAGALLVIAAGIWISSRLVRTAPVFQASREALVEDAEVWGIDLDPDHVLHDLPPVAGATVDVTTPSPTAGDTGPESAPPTVEQLQTQLRALRRGLRRSIVGDPPDPNAEAAFGARSDGAGGAPGSSSFRPKSQTMRAIMSVVKTGRGDGLTQQLPIKALIALAVSGALKGRTRWLVSLWPILRVISSHMAQAKRRSRQAWTVDQPVGQPSRTDAGNDDVVPTGRPTPNRDDRT